MTDKKKIITNLQKALNSLDVTSDLRLILIQTIEYLQEEPVSDELEEASKKWLRPQLDKSYANYGEGKMMELTQFDGYAMLDAIEFGAKWQKEQDQSIIELAEDHAYFAGSEAMREKILRKIEEAYKKGGVLEAMKIIRELKK